MTKREAYPGFLAIPSFMSGLRMQRYWYGDKGHPMTTSQRHQMMADWGSDRPYDSRIRGKRVVVIATPTGTKREVVWRAITRRWRSGRIISETMRRVAADATSSFNDMVQHFGDLGEQAASTASTIDDTLLAKVSRAEFYEAMASVHEELRRSDAMAIAFFACGLAMLLVAVALVAWS